MSVARHNRIEILAALCRQRLHKAKDQLDDLLDLLLDVQTHIECNLIVSRTAGVQTLAGITDALGQQLLDVHVDVLVIERELNLAVLNILEDALQTFDDLFGLMLLDDALLAQHGSVRDRSGDIFLI